MRRYLLSVLIIMFTFLSMCIYLKNEDWKPGEVVIKFKVGINETEARSIILSYNLTIVGISDDSSDIIVAYVKVPEGEENDYANMLKDNPSIDDAYMSPAPPR